MRKLLTLVAVAALTASPFVLADESTNSNDVLQTVQPQNNSNQPLTVAENDSNAQMSSNESSSDNKAMMKKKHHRHCKKHCHGKKPHHKHHVKSVTKTEQTEATTQSAS